MSHYVVAIAIADAEYDENLMYFVGANNDTDAMKEAVMQSYDGEETSEIVEQDMDELETIEDVQEYMFNGGYSISLPLKID